LSIPLLPDEARPSTKLIAPHASQPDFLALGFEQRRFSVDPVHLNCCVVYTLFEKSCSFLGINMVNSFSGHNFGNCIADVDIIVNNVDIGFFSELKV
jgi:hypothetical protein